MLLVQSAALALLCPIKEVARVELHSWSGCEDGHGTAGRRVLNLDCLFRAADHTHNQTPGGFLKNAPSQVHPIRC